MLERVWGAQKFTALLVTHDVTEAVTLADRVLLIEDGEIAMDVRVDLPRPRRRGSAEVAALEGRISLKGYSTPRATTSRVSRSHKRQMPRPLAVGFPVSQQFFPDTSLKIPCSSS
jgi:ABC-type sulfate/molybdate transport systems ATPase subunit